MLLNYLQYFTKKPKKLMLIDGIGAFYTATMLLIIKYLFISHIGLPPVILEYLAIMAYGMGLFSITTTIFVKKDFFDYMRAIAIVNLTYCIITIVILVIYHKHAMIWGIAYFVTEMLVIISLSLIEIRTSRILRSKKRN